MDDITELAQQVATIASKMEDIHRVFYRNGFKTRVDSIEKAVTEFNLTREATCPVKKIEQDERTVNEKKRFRRIEIYIAVFMVIITIVVGIPSWVNMYNNNQREKILGLESYSDDKVIYGISNTTN